MIPTHIIRPLTDHDRALLRQHLVTQKKSFRIELLMYAGVSFIAPFLTNRPNQKPMIENMSYGWAVLLFAGIMLIPLSFTYFGKVHKAVRALQKDTKRVILTTVTGKTEKPIFHKEDYCLNLDDGYVRKLYFPRSQFDKFQIDEHVRIELSEDGKQVIKITEATETLVHGISKMENLGPSDRVRYYSETLFAKSDDSKFSIRPFVSFFLPGKHDYITKIILDINLAVFVLMLLSGVKIYKPLVITLVHWGGNQWYPTIADHQYWRLVTNLFIHAGIVHLLFNMLSFLFIAIFLERTLGRLGFIMLYLVSGVAASLTSVLWHSNSIVSVGASGAIFGLYGFFLATLLVGSKGDRKVTGELTSSILIFIGYNLIMGITGNIDNAAHIGGLLSGFVIGAIAILFKVFPDKLQAAQYHEVKSERNKKPSDESLPIN